MRERKKTDSTAVQNRLRLVCSATVLLLLLLGTTVTSAQAPSPQTAQQDTSEQVTGNPDIEMAVSDNRFTPGGKTAMKVRIANSGDITRAGPSDLEKRVKTARNLRLSVVEQGLPEGIELQSGPILVGTMPDGASDSVSFGFDVGKNVETGSYEIPIKVEYDYTRLAERDGDSTRYSDFLRETTETVDIYIEDEARFSVSHADSSISAGDTGKYVIRIQNTGTETAQRPRISFSSLNGGVFFGGTDNKMSKSTVGSGPLPPGESQRVSVKAGAASEITPGMYPINVVVRYEDDIGVTHESRSLSSQLKIIKEQDFGIEGTESNLRVGESGHITGQITNNGPDPVESALVTLQPSSNDIDPHMRKYSVGDLQVGEEKRFEFQVSVREESEAAPRKTPVVIEYRNSEDELRRSAPIDLKYKIDSEVDSFDTSSDIELSPGSSKEVEVEVTNTEGEKLENIKAKAFADTPVSAGDKNAFIQQLKPNESEELVFKLSVGEDATAGTHSFSIDFTYDDKEGDSKLSNSHRVPVEVSKSQDGGSPASSAIWFGIAIPALLGAGWIKRDSLRELVSED